MTDPMPDGPLRRRQTDLPFLNGKLEMVRALARVVNELGLATVLVLGGALLLGAMLIGYIPTPWAGLERAIREHDDRATLATATRTVSDKTMVEILGRMERTQRYRECGEIKDAEWRRECLRP